MVESPTVRRKTPQNPLERTHGRTENYVVPVDADAESRLIGIALAHDRGYEAALMEGVQAGDFGIPRYGAAWNQIIKLYGIGAQVSAPLVAAPLLTQYPPKGEYPGIAAELAQLQATADVPMARRHAATVSAYAERRRLLLASIGFGHRVELADADTDGNQLLVEATTQFSESLSVQRQAVRSVGQVYDELVAEMANPPKPTLSGLPMLDEAWAGGLYPRRLYAFAARMKAGKTTLLQTIATHAAVSGVPVAYIALEMGAVDLLRRTVSRDLARPMRELLGEYNGDVIQQVQDDRPKWDKVPLSFYDRRGLDLEGLRGLLARLGATGYRGVVVDYWQLVRSPHASGVSRAEELTQIACAMAEAASTHGMWVLTAGQLNRDNPPKLRDSDGLLMSCDWLGYLQRSEPQPTDIHPGYYVEVRASRYTQAEDLGGPKSPVLELVGEPGPYFQPVSASDFNDASWGYPD